MSNIIANLALLFNSDDNVYLAGAINDEGKGYHEPRLAAFDNNFEQAILTEHQFYAINPISNTNRNIRADGSKGSYRASINVSEFRNFLLESDTLPLEVQLDAITHLSTLIPIRAVTFSGSKSYHIIISVADTLFSSSVREPITLYKQVWDGLATKAENIIRTYLNERSIEAPAKIFDTSTKDPARLSRLPGALRNGVEQSLVYSGGLVAADELLALSSEAKLHQYDGANTNVDISVDLASFEKRLRATSSLQFLRDRLEYPDRWTSASNMYTELFKYTLWCLDATSVPFNVLDTYFTKRVYPAILAKGYPRNPRAGVLAAYQYKNLI